jgi:hypothetical protein
MYILQTVLSPPVILAGTTVAGGTVSGLDNQKIKMDRNKEL